MKKAIQQQFLRTVMAFAQFSEWSINKLFRNFSSICLDFQTKSINFAAINQQVLANMEATNTIKAVERVSPLERARKVAERKGWGPLTEEEKVELDDLVRSFTNLN